MSRIQNDSSNKLVQATIAWIATILSVGYMLPWAIAASRGKSNSGAIGWLTLLLGWTLLGWVVALIMACGAHQVVVQPVIVQPGGHEPSN